MKEATIYDIAKRLSLSASTVSRALKENPAINIETRKRVLKCAGELGYRSNAFASNLRTKRTNTIGVIVPRLDSNFMSACLAGMEEVANEKGYHLIISQSHESVKREAQNANVMFNKRVDGVIASLTVENRNVEHFQCFADKKVPVVYFDRVPQNTSSTCFVIDNYESAYKATNHLIEEGCKRIAHLTLESNSNVYVDRIRGFKAALSDHHACCGDVIFLNALNLDTGKAFVQQFMQMKIKPDGIFVGNDLAAVGCIIGLLENGIKIPQEVAIVGFNDDPVSTIIQPQLSTITYPGREAGRLAAKSLIEHLMGLNNIEHTNKVVLNTNLIVRASSKKI
ncbi:MAG: LacI family DNA-binding transcriptional regulator [Prolixibacteraceae bacterium]